MHLGLNIAWSAVIATALGVAIPVTWYVAVKQLVRYFHALNAQRRGILEDVTAGPRCAEEASVAFLGDSITDQYPVDEYYPEFSVINRGVGGDTTLQVLDRLETTVYPLQPKLVILQIGTNDLFDRRSPEDIVTNIGRIVDGLQKHIPGVTVILVSVYPTNVRDFARELASIFVRFRSNKAILEINRHLRALAEERGLQYVDVHSHLCDELGNLKKEYSLEGLHLLAPGYAKVTEVIRPVLASLPSDLTGAEE